MNIPSRPQVSTTPLADQRSLTSSRLPSSLRAWRPVTDYGKQEIRSDSGQLREQRERFRTPEGWGMNASSSDTFRLLTAGMYLHKGRYRLHALQSRQEWASGTYEAFWIAQDAQRSGYRVLLCELVIPGQSISLVQSLQRTSTIALASIGRHTIIPTLWDVFSEYDRHFFVFKPVPGESLLMYMRRTGRALPEQDVIACCLQALEVLELLGQQTPPMVHGLIRPEHIVSSHDGASYRLTNFSVLLAGGDTRFISGMKHEHFSPYMAPELARGVADVRSDLYSLLATAYHVATGSMPLAMNGRLPQARSLNPMVTPQFEAILAKGLRSSIGERFQKPSELRQELLALQTISNDLSFLSVEEPEQRMHIPQPATNVSSQALTRFHSLDNARDDRSARLSPSPVPSGGNSDMRFFLFWIIGIALCLSIAVLLIRLLL